MLVVRVQIKGLFQPLRGELNTLFNIGDIHQASAAVTRIQCDVRQGIESWLYTIFAPFQ